MCIHTDQRIAEFREARIEQAARGAFLIDELRRAERLASVEYARTVVVEMRQLLADQDALNERIAALARELEATKRKAASLSTELL